MNEIDILDNEMALNIIDCIECLLLEGEYLKITACEIISFYEKNGTEATKDFLSKRVKDEHGY